MMNKNKNKGFTILGLLFIIIIVLVIFLAIYQQLNDVAEKSKESSFVDVYSLITNKIEICVIQNLDGNACKNVMELSEYDYDYAISGNPGGPYTITLEVKKDDSDEYIGTFKNIYLKDYYQAESGSEKGKKKIRNSSVVEDHKIIGIYKSSK